MPACNRPKGSSSEVYDKVMGKNTTKKRGKSSNKNKKSPKNKVRNEELV